MILTLFIILTILNVCYNVSSNNFGATFKMLRISGKTIKVEEVQRYEDLEYPRYNKEILQKVRHLWEKYYLCLEQQASKEKKMEIFRLLEGQNIELNCGICIKPFQNFNELEWKYKPLSLDTANKLEILDLTGEMVLTTDKNLQIYNVVVDFSGLYVCYQGKNAVSGYILEVSKNDTIEKVNETPYEAKIIFNSNDAVLKVYYKWDSWTECSSCGVIGRKFKYGFCFVFAERVRHVSLESTTIKLEETSSQSSILNLLKSKYVKPQSTESSPESLSEAAEVISKFETGIPCTSTYLPPSVSSLITKFTAVKALVKHCLVPCQNAEIFEVFDPSGKLIERSNNSAGIYSMFQKLPQLPPEIERRTIAAEFGKDVIFMCPGTVLTNTPVTWRVNKKVILPERIANESNGRFTVDLVNRIHIKKLRLQDSRIYSCWQGHKLAGTVNLIVEKEFKVGFDHHVTLIGMTLVVGTFLFVGFKVLKRELQSRKK